MRTAVACIIRGLLGAAVITSNVVALDEPEGLLDSFLTRTRVELDRLPGFTCTQTVERFRRSAPDQAWIQLDRLNLEVAALGDHELYARAGDRRFQTKPLAEMIGRGTTGTGHFANFAKQIFSAQRSAFTYKGETEQDGRRAHGFSFDIPAERSSYHLRSGTADAIVAFQGEFWVDAGTLDLARLVVQVYDIPDHLGLSQADTTINYSRADFGDGQSVLLPKSATLTIVASTGLEDLNRTRFNSCRRYQAESVVKFQVEPSTEAERIAPAPPPRVSIEPGTMLELALDHALSLTIAAAGFPIKARLTNEIRSVGPYVIPSGTVISGRIERIERRDQPFPTYDVALIFDQIEVNSGPVALFATMIDAGPASGLIRQSKRLEPEFHRKRAPGMNILVREVQRGQGILIWKADRGVIPAGFRMKWRAGSENTAKTVE